MFCYNKLIQIWIKEEDNTLFIPCYLFSSFEFVTLK